MEATLLLRMTQEREEPIADQVTVVSWPAT
jgi:hypothetical protein